MTIAALGKEIKGIVDKQRVYGAECVVNALVRACLRCNSSKYLTKDELIKLVQSAYEREEKRNV